MLDLSLWAFVVCINVVFVVILNYFAFYELMHQGIGSAFHFQY